MDICGTCKRALRGDDKHTVLRLRGSVRDVLQDYVRGLGKDHELELGGQYHVCSECFEVAKPAVVVEVNKQLEHRNREVRVTEEELSEQWTM